MTPRRALLVSAQVVLVVAYAAGLVVFLGQGRDFLVARNNGRAEAAAATYAHEGPRTYRFGAAQPDNALLGAGWWRQGTASTDGIWSHARAYVVLPISPEGALLTIVGEPFAAPGLADGVIELRVDGVPAGTWTVTHGTSSAPLVVSVPASAGADGRVVLQFDVPTAAVPEHYGAGDEDDRQVGLFLREIRVDPAPGRQSM
jgi:hypothetical protein